MTGYRCLDGGNIAAPGGAVNEQLRMPYDKDGNQVGFARLVTDRTIFAYLADIYVLAEYQGIGLGKALIDAVAAHPVLATVHRALLATRDAHGLYEPRGFAPLRTPEMFLEINRPGIYQNEQHTSPV